MRRVSIAAFVVSFLACPVAMAQVMSFGELQQKGVVKLSAQELRGIAQGAKVIDRAATGSVRQWENEIGGEFPAVSSNASTPGGKPVYGKGTWRIEDDGRYCVEIAWRTSTEKWCRHIFRSGDKLYSSTAGTKPDVKAYEIEFKK
jgi:hypothetical protein